MIPMDIRITPVAAAFLLIVALAPTGSTITSDIDPGRDVEPSPAYRDGFRWDFTAWDRDTNQDGLDDLVVAVDEDGIEALPRQADGFLPFSVTETVAGAQLDLHIAYDVGVGEGDIAAVEALGLEVVVDDVFPGAWVRGASTDDAKAIAEMPGVVMVEIEQVFRALNNVARKATQVEQSSTYPDDVWNDQGYTGDGVGIAILDTGVDDNHAFLAGQFIAGADSVDTCGVTSLPINPDDDHAFTFHGTHVAGTALGNGLASGSHAGMAPGADLYDVKVLNAAGTSCLNSVSNGLNFVYQVNQGTSLWQNALHPDTMPAGKRIDIVSLSLGGACSNGSDSLSQSVNWAVTFAEVVAVVATGNDGVHPSSGAGCITSPSAAVQAISVGAYHDKGSISRNDDDVASFSNCGPSVASPNSDQKKPDVTAPGVNIRSAQGSALPVLTAGSSSHSISGTSMATPVVSGIIALMLEKDPTLTTAGVKSILRGTADYKSSGFGYTIGPNYHSCWGFGQVNANDAVLAV